MAEIESERARCVFIVGPRNVEVIDSPVIAEPDHLIVESELIGISHGTEMLFYRGPFPSGHALEARDSIGGATDYPIAYGYMNVGVTEGRRVFAFAPHQDRVSIPADATIDVPDGISPEDAIFYASMETAVQIVHDAAPRLGERVLVSGLGVVGLLTAHLLRRQQLDVVTSDPIAQRRRRAEAFGCAGVDPHDGDPVAAVRDGYGPIDVAINVSASAEALQLAINTVAEEGRVVEASWYGDAPVELSLGVAFHRRRIAIRASQVSRLNPTMQPRWTRARRTALVWRLIREIGPAQYISHRLPLSDAQSAYELLDRSPEDVMQVVLDPREVPCSQQE